MMETERGTAGHPIVVETLASRMTQRIESQKAKGYLFAIVYVTPEEKEDAIESGSLKALEDGILKIHPSIGSDNVRLARGDANHAFLMAVWGDVYGLARVEEEKAAKAREIEDRIRAKEEAAAAKIARAEERAARRIAKEAAAAAARKAKAAKDRKKAGKSKKDRPTKAPKTVGRAQARADVDAV